MWTYNYTIPSDELYHHGILGQKWGRRRYQNEDGSHTPAGEKRYDDDLSNGTLKEKSKHRLRLESNYKNAGMSEEDAAKKADKRIKAEKILAISAGVAIAACAAYVGYNHLKERTDGLIKAGDTLQRIEGVDTKKLHEVFYASAGKHDNARYENMLGFQRKQSNGQAFMMKLSAKKDIKVASNDKAAKVFEDLLKNDSSFRNQMSSTIGNIKVSGKKEMKALYDSFNQNVIINKENKDCIRASATFFDKLKSSGYGAIKDINDIKYSGYNAKSPYIIFGNSDNVMVKTITEISKNENDYVKEYTKAMVDELIKMTPKAAAIGLTGAAVSTVANDYADQEQQTKSNRR